MEIQEIVRQLEQLLQEKDYRKLREMTEDMQPADLAEAMEEMDVQQRLLLFRLMKKEVAAEIFAWLGQEARGELIEKFSDAELTAALEEMALDDAADILEEMPASVVKRVLARSSKKTRESLNRLLNYPADSAGSIMTPEYIRLRRDMTVPQALDVIRQEGENSETVYTLYVTERNKLLGVVSARDLLLAGPEQTMEELMEDNVISVQVTDDKEEVANELNRYGFIAMPVVDSEGMLVGIVTVDDATDVLIEEATEDFEQMAAMQPNEGGYFATSVWKQACNRLPWLLVLMLSATFTGMILTYYEAAFAAMPLLVSFIPMLMDTGGNCGSQSSTLMVRGMAVGEIEPQDVFKVVWKEFRVASLVGVVLAIVNGLRIWLMYRDPMVALLITITLMAAVVISKLIGCILPLGVQKVGLDPAIIASPLITTVVDACVIMVYFTIAVNMFANLQG